MKRQWEQEYEAWCKRRLDQDRWVYLGVDGLHSGLRLDDERLCVRVVRGVNERGQKRFLALAAGGRESPQSWREGLLGLQARGLQPAPELAGGAGALGCWSAREEIYPATGVQRCWVHKTATVLNYLPKSVPPQAKSALPAIWRAPTRGEAERACKQFVLTYEANYPKATQCRVKDRDSLLACYDFPAEHWVHIRTTHPMESTFATIRHRSARTKGCVSRATMLSLIYKLGLSAEKRWQRLRGFEPLAKGIAGVRFTTIWAFCASSPR